MRYSVVYPVGAYDYAIEDNIPSLLLAHVVATGLQPYHDKPLEIKTADKVRTVSLRIANALLYDLHVKEPKEE